MVMIKNLLRDAEQFLCRTFDLESVTCERIEETLVSFNSFQKVPNTMPSYKTKLSGNEVQCQETGQ